MEDLVIQLLRERNEEGLRLLQEQYGNLVRYVVRGILRDERDTEECVSDIYLQVWAHFDQYNSEKGKLSTWLTAVSRNTALNRLKRKRADTETLDERDGSAPSSEEVLLRQERTRRLQEVVARLERGDRLLFYRKYYYLQSTAQIAAELGMTERAVEGRLYRLRRKLRDQLGGEGYE